jgi:iron complex transport system substrate-binding protein
MIKRTAALKLIVATMLMAPVLAPVVARADNIPRRIVSFNLCADQLLLALADRDQIAGLSPYAGDASLSVTTDAAQGFPKSDWDAESVVNLAPDLVLIGPRSAPTRILLDKLGVKIADVDLVSNLAAAEAQARELGKLFGHPERGEALARSLAQANNELAASAATPPRTALVVEREGYVEGAQSLVSSMLQAAGLRPPATAPQGFGGFISLEQLLVDAPDILVLQDPPLVAGDQGALFLTHPALLARYPASRRVNLPARYTLCGGPALQQGLSYLANVMKQLH